MSRQPFSLPNIIPLYGYVAFCFLIHRLMAIWDVFHLWAIMANAAMNTGMLNQVTSKMADYRTTWNPEYLSSNLTHCMKTHYAFQLIFS